MSNFSIVQIWVLRVNFFFFWLIFYPVDPHIFADPDPGSQNSADPTDPDPKHWLKNKCTLKMSLLRVTHINYNLFLKYVC